MTAKKFALHLSLALLVALLAAFLPFRSDAGGAQGGVLDVLNRQREAQAQQLEGSWTIVLTAPTGNFTSYGSFARGGVFTGSARVNAFSAGANPQHGVWEHRGGNRFAFTLKQDLLDAAGRFTGVFTADALITITGKDSFVGITKGSLRDASGNLLLDLECVPVRGERMKVGELPTQCQMLLPQ